MLTELLEHLAVARGDEGGAGPGRQLQPTTWASPPAPTSREPIDAEAKVRRMQLFADVYDEFVGFPKPTIAACHGDARRRRRRDRDLLRHADRRRQPSNALPRRRARRAGRPGPPRHPLRPRRRQVPAALLAARSAPTRRSASALVNRVAPASSTEDAALALGAEVAALYRRRGRRSSSAILHEWDDVEGRSCERGRAARSSGSAAAPACTDRLPMVVQRPLNKASFRKVGSARRPSARAAIGDGQPSC